MSKNFPGGWITKNPPAPVGPYETDAAPGIWSMTEQAYYRKQDLWPTAGNVASTGFLALVSGTYKSSQSYRYNSNSGNFLYAAVNGGTPKYVMEVDSTGAVQSQTLYNGGTSNYEEFGSWDYWYDDATETFYAPYVDGTSANMGVCKVTGSAGFGTGSTHVRRKQGGGSIKYPNSGVYLIGTPGTSTETLVTTAFGDGGGGGNQSSAYYGYWNPSSNTYYAYGVYPSSSDRVYSYGAAPTAYTNKLAFITIDNYPTQYAKSFWVSTFTAGSTSSGVVGKSITTTNAFMNQIAGEQGNTRWIAKVQNNDQGSISLFSFDYNIYVKDQLVLKDTAISNSAVTIVSFFYPGTANGAANEDDVLLLIKDPDSSQSYTYYLVVWRKDDNNNANDGGTGNSGGTWNYGSTAKKLVFDSGYCNNGSNGYPRAGYYTSSGTNMIVFGAQIGFGGVDMIFNIPMDISQLADGTYAGYVTISSGSSVNSRVDGFKNQSYGTSWSTRSTSNSSQGSTQNTTTASASAASVSPAFTNFQPV